MFFLYHKLISTVLKINHNRKIFVKLTFVVGLTNKNINTKFTVLNIQTLDIYTYSQVSVNLPIQPAWRHHTKKQQICYWPDDTGRYLVSILCTQCSYCNKNWLWSGWILRNCLNAKISPKADSREAQTIASENRIYLKCFLFFFNNFYIEWKVQHHFWYTQFEDNLCTASLHFSTLCFIFALGVRHA